MNNKIKLIDIVNEYLEICKTEKSINTYKYYKSKMTHFLRWANSNNITYISEVDNKCINSYIYHLKKTCINKTINKHVKSLQLFYKRMKIDFEYLQELNKIPETTKSIEIIDYKVLELLVLYMLSLDSSVGNNLIYQVIFFLLVETGARINEILKIEKKYVDTKNNTITLSRTKSGTHRKVFYTDELSGKYINELLLKKNPTKYLLYNSLKNKEVNYEVVRYLMKILKEKFNLTNLYPHLFRHTIATYWLENGADVYFVQKVLGHSNTKITERYLHESTKYRKKVFDQVKFNLK